MNLRSQPPGHSGFISSVHAEVDFVEVSRHHYPYIDYDDRISDMSGETLKTIERMLQLLKVFSRAHPEMTTAELVRHTGMPRPVVQRILTTLVKERMLERAPDSLRYRVGVSACELGALYLTGNPLIQASHEALQRLAAKTGFPVYLGIRIDGDVSILAMHQGRTNIRFVWGPGDRLPVATTALGKAILMHLAPGSITAIIGSGPVRGLTDHSIRTLAQLRGQLKRCAPQKWIPALEESMPGVYAVGAAVLAETGTPIAGISVSFLRDDSDESQVERIGTAVRETAKEVSARVQTFHHYGGAMPSESLPRQNLPTGNSASSYHGF